MPIAPLPSLADTARVWVFGGSQPLLGPDADRLIGLVDDFVHYWAAHGSPVVGSRDWRYDRFLLVAADEEATGVSGCSIDSLFRALRAAEGELGVTLLNTSLVFFRDSMGIVHGVDRPRFRDLVRLGEIGHGTTVFDNTVGRLGAVRAGEWERPFSGSWQERAFRTPARVPLP
jgi:hypothetical protein